MKKHVFVLHHVFEKNVMRSPDFLAYVTIFSGHTLWTMGDNKNISFN